MKSMRTLLSLLIIMCILATLEPSYTVDAKQTKKRKRKKKGPKPQSTGPINERYVEIERDLYCYSC